MNIELTGGNRQLLNEYLVEQYKAELSERYNHWPAQQKHLERAAKKLNILFGRLHLDEQIHSIQIDVVNNCVIASNKVFWGKEGEI